MASSPRSLLEALALSCLVLPAAARVIWIPEEFNPDEGRHLFPRQEPTCGGDSSLSQCGGDFPEDFCCPTGTQCLSLQTDPSITASICCPQGSDCRSIGTVSCDQDFQNATLLPQSQLHSEPTAPLDTCGESCCPMGYKCQGGNSCIALSSEESSSSGTPAATGTSTSTSQSDSATTPAGNGVAIVPGDPSHDDSSDSDAFNPKSFAAGFVPGIAIGALIAACLLLLLLRRKRKSSDSYSGEKGHRDTLTDLSTSPEYKPTMHGRSISEPVVDPRFGNRNDFLRGSPPRGQPPLGNTTEVRADTQRPITPGRTPKIKQLFSHSPFMVPQTPSTPPTAPVPAHLKRGTLSFKISPVRALKKQKSMHSLRRQMTDASNGVNRSNSRPKLGRSDSQETILVQLTGNEPYTPDRGAAPMPSTAQTLDSSKYRPHDSTSTWISDTATSEDDTPDERAYTQPAYQPAPLATRPPIANPTHTTPTRPPMNPNTGALGSPYTPTNQGGKTGGGNGMLGANLNRQDTRRDTTFSAMMERVGLRRSDLVPVPPVPKGAR